MGRAPLEPIPFEQARLPLRVRSFVQDRLVYVLVAEAVLTTQISNAVGLTGNVSFVAVCVLVFGTVRYVTKGQKAAQINSPVLLLEESGDYSGSLGMLHESATTCTDVIARATLALNLGYVMRRAGRVEAARMQFLEVQKVGVRSLRTVLSSNLAFVNVLLDDIEEAEKHLSPTSGVVGATQTVYWARIGDVDSVQGFTARKAKFGTKKMYLHETRLVSLMKAFTAKDRAACVLQLALARQSFAGEYDYLVGNWQELATFLREHMEALAPDSSPLPQARLVSKRQKLSSTLNS